MAVFEIKTAGRVFFRRLHLPTSKTNIKKRYFTSGDPRLKPEDPAKGTSIPVPNTVPTLPLWQRLGPLSRAFRAYGRSQRKRPLTTQVISSLVVFSLGDLAAQKINGDKYDPARTGRALIIGGIASIPSYKWFIFLGNSFNYRSKALSLSTKIIVNQACFTPINNTFFFGMQAFLAWDSWDEIWDRIKRTVPTSMINSLKLWPAVTAFNFTFIDAQYRSIFAGVIAVGWQAYLSYLNRRAEVEERIQKTIEESGEGGKSQEVMVQQQGKIQKAEA